MPRRRQSGLGDEHGFTLVELLVVILIIGILAAVAIPALMSQSHKAYDASAKQLVNSAQTAAESIAVEHEGSYGEGSTSFISKEAIHTAEPTIPITAASAAGGAWLYEANAIESGAGYELVTLAPKTEGEKFSTIRRSSGEIERKCTPVNAVYGCATGSW